MVAASSNLLCLPHSDNMSSTFVHEGMTLREALKKLTIPPETSDLVQAKFQGFSKMLMSRVLARLTEEGQYVAALCRWDLASFDDLKEVIESTLFGGRIEANLALVLNRASKVLEVGGSLVIANRAGDPVEMGPPDFNAISDAIMNAVTDILEDKESGCIKARPGQYNGRVCKSYGLDLGIFSIRFTPVLALAGDREYYTFNRTKVVNKIIHSGASPAEKAASVDPLLRELFPVIALAMRRLGLLDFFPRTALYRFYVELVLDGLENARLKEGEERYCVATIRDVLQFFLSNLLGFKVFLGEKSTPSTSRYLFSAFDESIMVFDLLPKDGTMQEKIAFFCESVMPIALDDDVYLVKRIATDWRAYAPSI